MLHGLRLPLGGPAPPPEVGSVVMRYGEPPVRSAERVAGLTLSQGSLIATTSDSDAWQDAAS